MGDQLAPGRYAFFEVEDDGCGMEESIRARIFEPFFSTKFTGRGLGLAAVRGIVQGHGGAFEVESRVRQGTRIRVIFPVSDSQVLGRSNDDRVKASRCFSGTVLLVDDEATPRRVTARILEKIGYECVQAENGEEALERFREDPHRFRLVVLDVVMPVLDGPGCYQQLRRVRPECPVLFISGYDDGGLMTELSNPFTAFLQKPYGIPAFKEACCRLTEPTRQENSQGT